MSLTYIRNSKGQQLIPGAHYMLHSKEKIYYLLFQYTETCCLSKKFQVFLPPLLDLNFFKFLAYFLPVLVFPLLQIQQTGNRLISGALTLWRPHGFGDFRKKNA